MSEKDGVELSKYGAGRMRVDESVTYIRDQERVKPWAKKMGLSFLFMAMGLTYLKNDPVPQAPKTEGGPIPPASMNPNPATLDSELYNRGDDHLRMENDRRHAPVASTKLSGPALIPRSTKIKVPPGTEARGILVTGASNGLVKVKLKEDVVVAGESYLAAGTMILGSGSSSDDRLFVHFKKAVSDDGTVATIEAEIADGADKTIGLKGSFWATHGGHIAAGAGLNFVAGASEALEDTQGQQGAVVTKPTLRNAILNGTARSALDESNEVASRYKNSPPAVEIKAGTEVTIIFTENGN